jgi:hypothetical protein
MRQHEVAHARLDAVHPRSLLGSAAASTCQVQQPAGQFKERDQATTWSKHRDSEPLTRSAYVYSAMHGVQPPIILDRPGA